MSKDRRIDFRPLVDAYERDGKRAPRGAKSKGATVARRQQRAMKATMRAQSR